MGQRIAIRLLQSCSVALRDSSGRAPQQSALMDTAAAAAAAAAGTPAGVESAETGFLMPSARDRRVCVVGRFRDDRAERHGHSSVSVYPAPVLSIFSCSDRSKVIPPGESNA